MEKTGCVQEKGGMYVDAARRKLKIPSKFLPYMEKFRLYELFHELASELVIKQPEDHIQYLSNILIHAAETINARRIIIIGPPFLDKTEIISELLKEVENLYVVNITEMKEKLDKYHGSKYSKEKFSAKYIKRLVQNNHDKCSKGWLLLDYPQTRQEGVALQKIGILPTHVFQLVPAFSAPMKSMEREDIPFEWKSYRFNLVQLRQIFRKRWHEISMNQKEVTDIIKMIKTLLINNKHCGAPMVLRLCLIGPVGSGCNSVAKAISHKLNIDHIHFPTLLRIEFLNKNSPYNILKENPIDPNKRSRIHSEILFRKLLESKCVDYGWILTGYPETLLDMKRLDKMQTPPNRVIFLDCSDGLCVHRTTNRKVNIVTGSITNIALEPLYEKDHKLVSHPNDSIKNVQEQLKIYRTNEKYLKQYCGATASYISSEIPLPELIEKCLSVVIKPLPDVPPRNPFEVYDNVRIKNPTTTERCLFKRVPSNIPPPTFKVDEECFDYVPEPKISDYCAELKQRQEDKKLSMDNIILL